MSGMAVVRPLLRGIVFARGEGRRRRQVEADRIAVPLPGKAERGFGDVQRNRDGGGGHRQHRDRP